MIGLDNNKKKDLYQFVLALDFICVGQSLFKMDTGS